MREKEKERGEVAPSRALFRWMSARRKTSWCNNFEIAVTLIPRLIEYIRSTHGQISGELICHVYDAQVCAPLYGSSLLMNYDLDRYTRHIRPLEISVRSILLYF